MKIDPNTFSDLSALEKCRAVFLEKNNAKILKMRLQGLGSLRSVHRHRQVWRGLSQDARKRLPNSRLAQSFDALHKLAHETSQRQHRILDAYFSADGAAKTLQDAIDIVDLGSVQPAFMKQYRKRRAALDGMTETELDYFVGKNLEAIRAALKRMEIL